MNRPRCQGLARISFPALGTTVSAFVTDAAQRDTVDRLLRVELEAMDRAASRFRSDSELVGLNAAGGQPLRVSSLLFRAVREALRAAELTCGLVDPTVGQALILAGYDRDFEQIAPSGPPLRLLAKRVPGWQTVRADPSTLTVQLPVGVTMDLGATAKALCADLAAERAHSETGAGILVSLGGDIAVRGPVPDGGWSIRVTHDHGRCPALADGPVISIRSGGLATSSTSVRRWLRGAMAMHHLIDPSTGLPAPERWRTVSVAASSCLDANIASCAAILVGDRAPAWLSERALPARLVDPAGNVTCVGGWPAESEGRPAVSEARQ